MIADLSQTNPIAMMVFVLQHNAPAAPIAPAAHHTASVVFALPPAPLIRNVQVEHRIAAPARVSNAPLIPTAPAAPHIV